MERKRMYKKVKRVLVLGVLALFAALVYAEGEQETGATKESGVTVREEKSKSSALKEHGGYDEIEQATRRGYEKSSKHGKKRKHSHMY